MKKIISVLLLFAALASLFACGKVTDNVEFPDEMPEDFSFYVEWGTFGDCYYDSEKQKASNYKPNKDRHTVSLALDDEQLSEIYEAVKELDITRYPDEFDPLAGQSDPHLSLELTVRFGDFEKTVSAPELATKKSATEKGQDYINTVYFIAGIIMSTEEWESLPEIPILYD